MAEGGAILGAALVLLRDSVRPGMTTLELDQIAERFIRDHDGATPAFKGLYGFRGSACISINEEIVHGIPSKKRVLNLAATTPTRPSPYRSARSTRKLSGCWM